MATIEQTPEVRPERPATAVRNGRWSGYTHLLMARMKELKREPEVIFWVFGFPILLALGLGIAFRNKPADRASVVIVSGAASSETLSTIQRSPAHGSIRADVLDENASLRGFRLG